MIKQYKKTYEDVFTSERLDKKCTLEKLDFNGEMTSGEYIKIFSDLIDEYQIILFDKWIKLYWLVINFSYNGTVSKNLMPTNASHDAAFTVFCRNYINFNRRFLSHGMYFNKITQYFPELFPNFSSENPFKIPYEYPFEYMTFDCMILVYQ